MLFFWFMCFTPSSQSRLYTVLIDNKVLLELLIISKRVYNIYKLLFLVWILHFYPGNITVD